MTNPFDDEGGLYKVLINDEKQYSLWPNLVEIPAGWNMAFGPEIRKECLEFIEKEWTDMRPGSLVKSMSQHLAP